jgi:CubicO group peptidase (beta-lactamase class C family)
MLEMAAGAALKDRGHYRNSNLGYALLGQILAANTGGSYATLLQEKILDPLGIGAKQLIFYAAPIENLADRSCPSRPRRTAFFRKQQRGDRRTRATPPGREAQQRRKGSETRIPLVYSAPISVTDFTISIA